MRNILIVLACTLGLAACGMGGHVGPVGGGAHVGDRR
jgi:hypothetical protein